MALQFVRELRQENDWVPVIVLSGLAEAESEYEGLDVVFRQKPVPPPELIALVRASLEGKRQRPGGGGVKDPLNLSINLCSFNVI